MASPSVELLEDICTRFILTAPAEQLQSFESMMFLVEQAHWYYEDFVREGQPSLRSYSLKEFASQLFENSQQLRSHLDLFEEIFERFKEFKKQVPVMGAILLDKTMDRVLLVKGWKSASSWGFPRGKINKGETHAECAVREVYEETGYDIEKQLNEDDYIELKVGGKLNKLYIIPGLAPESVQFAPKCRGEIGAYAWYHVKELPSTQQQSNLVFTTSEGARHKFFMVWPFVRPLRRWINKKRREMGQGAMFASMESSADLFNNMLLPSSATESSLGGSVNIPVSSIINMLAAANGNGSLSRKANGTHPELAYLNSSPAAAAQAAHASPENGTASNGGVHEVGTVRNSRAPKNGLVGKNTAKKNGVVGNGSVAQGANGQSVGRLGAFAFNKHAILQSLDF